MNERELDIFAAAYEACALWSDGYDRVCADLSAAAKAEMREDCKMFLEQCGYAFTDKELEQAGHDFWLTRNGHGAGFWDGGWEEELGSRLTELSQLFSPCDLQATIEIM